MVDSIRRTRVLQVVVSGSVRIETITMVKETFVVAASTLRLDVAEAVHITVGTKTKGFEIGITVISNLKVTIMVLNDVPDLKVIKGVTLLSRISPMSVPTPSKVD